MNDSATYNWIESKTGDERWCNRGPYRLVVLTDDFAESPRRDDDCNLGNMFISWNRYRLGDGPVPVAWRGRKGSTIARALKIYAGAKVVLPIYVYEHGGVSVATSPYSSHWDSGCAGMIYDTPKSRRVRYGFCDVSSHVVQQTLENEVATYDAYLRSDVYRWRLVDTRTGDTADGCGGYIGDWNECAREGLDALEDLYGEYMESQAPMFSNDRGDKFNA